MASSLTSDQLLLNDVTLTSGSSGTILTSGDISEVLQGIDWHYLDSTWEQWTYPQGGATATTTGTSLSSSVTLSSLSVGGYGAFAYLASSRGTYYYIYLPSSGTYLYSATQTTGSSAVSSGTSYSYRVVPNLSHIAYSGGTQIGYAYWTRHSDGDDGYVNEYYNCYGWYYRVS